MEIDVLVRIFKSFNIIELTAGISRVCSSWRLACCDPVLWRTLDLRMLQSHFIQIPSAPYVWVGEKSDQTFMRVLKIALGLSRGSVTVLMFHFNTYPNDSQLIYAAERCPRLKRLVLPAWNRITKVAICKAVNQWEELESLTMPTIANPPYIMEAIGANCKNFSQLKVMGPCNILFASSIVTFLPKLRVLSLRCVKLHKEALVHLLESLEHLEVLNISHCLLVEAPPSPASVKVFRELDDSILEKASRLREFLTCQDNSCTLCARTIKDDGMLRWYKYEEGLWCTDEVSSFAL